MTTKAKHVYLGGPLWDRVLAYAKGRKITASHAIRELLLPALQCSDAVRGYSPDGEHSAKAIELARDVAECNRILRNMGR